MVARLNEVGGQPFNRGDFAKLDFRRSSNDRATGETAAEIEPRKEEEVEHGEQQEQGEQGGEKGEEEEEEEE